ncbi:hypothetical protein, partial [Klebsiella pneumoniae]|uniref:hypothetical protein n=1 Tax=Klebsiella pneumoniae TaxID=573 RepID=UPI001954D3C7
RRPFDKGKQDRLSDAHRIHHRAASSLRSVSGTAGRPARGISMTLRRSWLTGRYRVCAPRVNEAATIGQ